MRINKIEIRYFRSIYHATLTNLNDITVFSGKNDVGKSNALKALNLFFNNYIVSEGDFVFSENYNLQRLDEARRTKGKQFIQISVTFYRDSQYEITLPKTFTITKKWIRDSELPNVSDNIEKQLKMEGRIYNAKSRSSLTRFLNRIEYIYIAAIKDNAIFEGMIERLQRNIYSHRLSGNSQLNDSLRTLYDNMVDATKELSDEFKKATAVDSMIATPTEVDELYKTLQIITKMGTGTVSLENRGDGIRIRYIPSIMHYIAVNSRNKDYIWGFEEPENSLEFNLARLMATDFYNVYSKRSMILLTTHSPAFIDLGTKERGRAFRCFKSVELKTEIVDYEHAKDLPSLADELGYSMILQKQYDDLKRALQEKAEMKLKVEKLEEEIRNSSKTVLLTEGKTDVIILKKAWEKLYEVECPFEIKSCNLVEENNHTSVAGAGILKNKLLACSADSKNVVIGMFDNDKEGKKNYVLDNNYKEPIGRTWKKHVSEKGYAFVIPASTDELKEIEKIDNLSIEFLFSEASLQKKHNGRGLEFTPMKVITKVNGVDISCEETSRWYYSSIQSDSKNYFANAIVPTFDKEEFKNFEPLFAIIQEIIDDIDKENTVGEKH